MNHTRTANYFPQTVPILSGQDFCQGSISSSEKFDMIGWFRNTFGSEAKAVAAATKENSGSKTGISLRKQYDDFGARALQAIMIEARRVDKDSYSPSFYGKLHGASEVTTFNDNMNRKSDTLARVWNRSMARLGYSVGNPKNSR